jgi:hypothetical protein
MKIKIVSNFVNYESIISNSIINQSQNMDIEIQPTKNRRLRGADPTITIAIISAASGALGILLSGLVELIKGKADGKIIIQCKDSKIEVPKDYPLEKLDVLINKIKKLEVEEIKILRV